MKSKCSVLILYCSGASGRKHSLLLLIKFAIHEFERNFFIITTFYKRLMSVERGCFAYKLQFIFLCSWFIYFVREKTLPLYHPHVINV